MSAQLGTPIGGQNPAAAGGGTSIAAAAATPPGGINNAQLVTILTRVTTSGSKKEREWDTIVKQNCFGLLLSLSVLQVDSVGAPTVLHDTLDP